MRVHVPQASERAIVEVQANPALPSANRNIANHRAVIALSTCGTLAFAARRSGLAHAVRIVYSRLRRKRVPLRDVQLQRAARAVRDEAQAFRVQQKMHNKK